MNFKPVVLIYDLNNALVDECAKLVGKTGLYTAINTYNETNALETLRQYDRLFGVLTNKLSCVITGWNHHKKMRDQFLFKMRIEESRGPFRRPTPAIVVTEDHRFDLKSAALDPTDGYVAAYLHADDFQQNLAVILHKVAFEGKSHELNSIAYAKLRQEGD